MGGGGEGGGGCNSCCPRQNPSIMGITVTFNVESLKVDPVKWDSKIEVAELLPFKMYPFALSLGYLLKYYSGKFVSVVKIGA